MTCTNHQQIKPEPVWFFATGLEKLLAQHITPQCTAPARAGVVKTVHVLVVSDGGEMVISDLRRGNVADAEGFCRRIRQLLEGI